MSKMNCIIIHGCPSNVEKAMNPETRMYDKHWMPYLKRELASQGIETQTPLMPDPWDPVYEKFKNEFEKCFVNDQTVLIGHSCGCAFLVRWLGETKRTIKKLILVAPWKIAQKSSPLEKAFYNFDIDKTLRSRVEEIIMFTADDEEEDGKKGLETSRILLFHAPSMLKHGVTWILDSDQEPKHAPCFSAGFLTVCSCKNKAGTSLHMKGSTVRW